MKVNYLWYKIGIGVVLIVITALLFGCKSAPKKQASSFPGNGGGVNISSITFIPSEGIKQESKVELKIEAKKEEVKPQINQIPDAVLGDDLK